jgi:hypothetical protein
MLDMNTVNKRKSLPRTNSYARQPRFDAGHEHGKQTNEFAAHEQLRAAAARS